MCCPQCCPVTTEVRHLQCGQTDVIVAGNLKCKQAYCLVREEGGRGWQELSQLAHWAKHTASQCASGQSEHDESASVPEGVDVIVEAD